MFSMMNAKNIAPLFAVGSTKSGFVDRAIDAVGSTDRGSGAIQAVGSTNNVFGAVQDVALGQYRQWVRGNTCSWFGAIHVVLLGQ